MIETQEFIANVSVGYSGHCDVCGCRFSASQATAKYCGQRCKATARKRRQREKWRVRKLRAQGAVDETEFE